MPFRIRKFKTGWRVYDDKGKSYSKKPLSKKTATAQLRALYANIPEARTFRGSGYCIMDKDVYLDGDGFFSDFFGKVKDVAKGIVNRVTGVSRGIREGYSPKARSYLQKYGNYIVTNIFIRRKPIIRIIDRFLNIVSLGKLDEAKAKLNYDNLFHLSMVFALRPPNRPSGSGGAVYIRVEKNEVINIDELSYKEVIDQPYIQFGVPLGFTFKGMMDEAQASKGPDFFKYDAFNNNCQIFVAGILNANGLLTERLKDFILQDTESILKQLPSYVKPFARGVTDIGALANVALEGQGMIKMTAKDFIREHKKLVKLLNDTSMKLGKEAKEQSAEAKAKTGVNVGGKGIRPGEPGYREWDEESEEEQDPLDRNITEEDELPDEINDIMDMFEGEDFGNQIQEIRRKYTRTRLNAIRGFLQRHAHFNLVVPYFESGYHQRDIPLIDIINQAIGMRGGATHDELAQVVGDIERIHGNTPDEIDDELWEDLLRQSIEVVAAARRRGIPLEEILQFLEDNDDDIPHEVELLVRGAVDEVSEMTITDNEGVEEKDEDEDEDEEMDGGRMANTGDERRNKEQRLQRLTQTRQSIVSRLADLQNRYNFIMNLPLSLPYSEKARLRQEAPSIMTEIESLDASLREVDREIGQLRYELEGAPMVYSGGANEMKWIQNALKKMKKNVFTKQALGHHKTPEAFAAEVLKHPKKYKLTTRRRAQFLENVSKKKLKGGARDIKNTLKQLAGQLLALSIGAAAGYGGYKLADTMDYAEGEQGERSRERMQNSLAALLGIVAYAIPATISAVKFARRENNISEADAIEIMNQLNDAASTISDASSETALSEAERERRQEVVADAPEVAVNIPGALEIEPANEFVIHNPMNVHRGRGKSAIEIYDEMFGKGKSDISRIAISNNIKRDIATRVAKAEKLNEQYQMFKHAYLNTPESDLMIPKAELKAEMDEVKAEWNMLQAEIRALKQAQDKILDTPKLSGKFGKEYVFYEGHGVCSSKAIATGECKEPEDDEFSVVSPLAKKQARIVDVVPAKDVSVRRLPVERSMRAISVGKKEEKHKSRPTSSAITEAALPGMVAKRASVKSADKPVMRRLASAKAIFKSRKKLTGNGSDKFIKQLDDAGMTAKDYLKKARAAAKKAGYDGRAVELADDGVHKLMIYDDKGNAVKFGRVGYKDFIIWTKVSPSEAEKKRKAYRARATKIKGDWENDKFSPNNLAINILW